MICVVWPAGLIEQRDSQPILKLIDTIGDWPVASDDWNTTSGSVKIPLSHPLISIHSISTAHVKYKYIRIHINIWAYKYSHMGAHKHCTAVTPVCSYSDAHTHANIHQTVFAHSEMLSSTSFVGMIKKHIVALQLSSQVLWLGVRWVGREAGPQSGLWLIL